MKCVSGTVDLSWTASRLRLRPQTASGSTERWLRRRVARRGEARRPSHVAADDESARRHRGARRGPGPDHRGRRRLRCVDIVQHPRRPRRSTRPPARCGGPPSTGDSGSTGRVPRPPVAEVPAAQRAGAQGPDLRADRCAARGSDHVAAGDAQGERNWDYRYAWIRDSTFALWGLYTLGLDREANDFFYFIADVGATTATTCRSCTASAASGARGA